MRNPAFCICENKDADNREADPCLCFRYMDSTIPLLPKCGISSLLQTSVAVQLFVSDLVRNPEDRFFHNEAHFSHDCIVIKIHVGSGERILKLNYMTYTLRFGLSVCKHA